eukprot:UN17952
MSKAKRKSMISRQLNKVADLDQSLIIYDINIDVEELEKRIFQDNDASF